MKRMIAVYPCVLIIMMVANDPFAAEQPIGVSNQTQLAGSGSCQGITENLARLHSDNAAARETGAKAIVECRKQIIESLTAIVAGNASEDAKIEAVRLLGAYRSREAISLLLENFRIGVGIHVGSMISDAESFPAGDALVQIGEPSVPAIIEKISATGDRDTRSVYLYVLKRIEGDKEILKLRIQRVLDQETVASRRANLEKAIAELRTPN